MTSGFAPFLRGACLAAVGGLLVAPQPALAVKICTEVDVICFLGYCYVRIKQKPVIIRKRTILPDGTIIEEEDPIVDIYFYSDKFDVDTSLLVPSFSGDPGAGLWDFSLTSSDALGNPLPYTGIRFFLTSGDGISFGENAEFSFALNGSRGIYKSTMRSDFLDSATGLWTYGYPCRSCVPEPDAWAMIIAGFGLVGWASRRRRFAPRGSPALASVVWS